MRSHEAKFDRYERGEGNACSIAWGPIIGGVLGAAGGLLGSKKQADAQEYAADKNAEAATRKFFGPGMDYVPGILGDASGIYGQGGFAPQANMLELLGRQSQLGYAENTLPGLIGSAQNSWQQGLSGQINPYVGAMIESGQNDMAQDFLRTTLPALSDQAQAVGGYGGSRQGVAQGVAAEGLMEAQGDFAAKLLNNAWNQGQQQQRAAWGAAPDMTGLGLMPSQVQQDVGAMYRGDAAQPAQNLQGYAGVVTPFTNSGGGYQAGYTAAPSALGGAIQGAIGGGAAGNWLSGIFSQPQQNVSVNPGQSAQSFDPGGVTQGLF